MAGASWRYDEAVRVAKVTAWTTAALQRQKTMPTLATWLGEKGPATSGQTVEQQAAAIRLLHAMHGGTLIDRGTARA